ncbi:HAMP domain-containing protein [candidate division KSB1 bacterium]|nr:HAMP domain-containing protein [candidate division KSB1 bacterium]
MDVFIFWMIIIAVMLSGYSFYLWRRAKGGFRFEARLTIIFFLFILVPTVPLTLFVSVLLTQSTELLLPPEVQTSLERSLSTIKIMVEARGNTLLQNCPNLRKLDNNAILANRLLYAAQMKCTEKGPEVIFQFSQNAEYFNAIPELIHEDFHRILRRESTSSFRQFDDAYFIEVYKPLSDSTISLVAYPVSKEIVESKNYIAKSLNIYKSLVFIKREVIRGNLIWALSIIFIIILALIAIYAAKLFSRGISEPINQLTRGMQIVAAGDLTYEVKTAAKDEIQFLVESFNRMTTDLRQSREKLLRTERIAAWRDVARRISHEIKNPLTPIQISLHRLRSKINVSREEQLIFDQSIRTINEEIESLRRLADEFSRFARMPQPKLAEAELNHIIRSIIVLKEGEPTEIAYKLQLSEDIPLLLLDAEQIRRAINNLLKNSAEASPHGGTITITTEPISSKSARVKLTIADQGEGIDPDKLEKIYEPYFTTKEGGMGLGLAIVKRIVEDHSGTLTIESQKGIGTKIEILL